MARDVFRSPEAPYVLKLQAGKWHTTSIAAEAIRPTTIHQATVTIHSLQRPRAQAGVRHIAFLLLPHSFSSMN